MANPVCINCLEKLKNCRCRVEEEDLNEDYASYYDNEDWYRNDDKGKAFIFDDF